MKKIELNIFVEDAIDRENLKKPDLALVTQKLKKMTEFFLTQDEWVEKSCLKGYKYKTLTFDVVLCDDEKIHGINRDYRNIDRPTDVISFAIFADSNVDERFIFDDEINLGEIIISLEKTLVQAQENGKTFEGELYFLLAHGILHLMGYDHLTEETLCEMWDIQEKMIGGSNV